MSEASDARIVIVSEESGKISVAIAGEITREVNEAGLRDMLMWGKPNKQKFNLFRRRGK
jgi:diadenylate cyclase